MRIVPVKTAGSIKLDGKLEWRMGNGAIRFNLLLLKQTIGFYGEVKHGNSSTCTWMRPPIISIFESQQVDQNQINTYNQKFRKYKLR